MSEQICDPHYINIREKDPFESNVVQITEISHPRANNGHETWAELQKS